MVGGYDFAAVVASYWKGFEGADDQGSKLTQYAGSGANLPQERMLAPPLAYGQSLTMPLSTIT